MIQLLGGFIAGVIFTIISFIVAYVIVEKLIFRHGKQMVRKIEDKVSEFEQSTMDKTDIVYPNYTEEVFLTEGTTLNDNLQN